MVKGLKFLTNDRGLTLIELMVAITIAIVVLAPIYEVLLTGNKVQIKSFEQVNLQEKTHQVINQMVEGKNSGSSRIGGLREANTSQVTMDPTKGIAFVSGGKLVTYYFKNQKIYYQDQDYTNGPIPLNDISASGLPVLENVQSLTIQTLNDGKKMYQISINAGKRLASGGNNEITLTTKVRPRN